MLLSVETESGIQKERAVVIGDYLHLPDLRLRIRVTDLDYPIHVVGTHKILELDPVMSAVAKREPVILQIPDLDELELLLQDRLVAARYGPTLVVRAKSRFSLKTVADYLQVSETSLRFIMNGEVTCTPSLAIRLTSMVRDNDE